ncbi:MAG: glycerol-3-phosphate 1-O-acyltransferase PlsY [Deltaproteobacteria bacterium]|nr:glycerol-3-phosphate 1-O-acyltransferase PlsY [Deltaproteobacteria bacterium]
MIVEIVLILASYLVGSIPFGLLVGRIAGIDVRREGSGNIGATNVGRLLGKKKGFLTLLCDVAKGFLPVWGATLLLPETTAARELIVVLCGLATVIGHMFPLYLKFKGGKGVATALGVFLFISPGSILITLIIFLAVVSGSGYVSVGSLAASALLPLWLWILGEPPQVLMVAVVIALLIWFKHRSNIGRLLRGEEKGWKKG